jgi:hypothetical protein
MLLAVQYHHRSISSCDFTIRACAHSPARAAAPLVLDGRCIDASPVDEGRLCSAHDSWCNRHESSAGVKVDMWPGSEVGRLKFLVREI